MALTIKICGNTDAHNLNSVCQLAPDYLGFIFYEKSKRYITNAKAVAQPSECKAQRVGVFVNAPIDEIKQKIVEFKLDIIQLHGNETPEFCFQIGRIKPIIKAFQIYNNFRFDSLIDYLSMCYMFLFDTNTKSYGGSGKKFDWTLLKYYTHNKSFILGGGISPDDATKINALHHPMLAGIDLNSKFELNPGIKDLKKLTTFINEIRA